MPEPYNIKSESDKYLKQDCEVLKRVFYAIQKQMNEDYNINILDYLTLAGTAFRLWQSMLPQQNLLIEIPDDDQKYDVCNNAIYGGRCQPLKRHFVSSDSTNFETCNDHLLLLDVVSLYPASMSTHEGKDFYFPTGYSSWADSTDIIKIQSFIDNK